MKEQKHEARFRTQTEFSQKILNSINNDDQLSLTYLLEEKQLVKAGLEKLKDPVTEARKLICEQEIAELQGKLEQLKQRLIANQRPCLPHGPEGRSKVNEYNIGVLDGQVVQPVNGVAVIVDPRSPYDGLGIEDYLEQVATPWLRKSAGLTSAHRQKQLDEGVEPKDIQRRLGAKLPAWPEGIVKHL